MKQLQLFERGYEAHKNVIDIQFPIIGKERIKWSHVDWYGNKYTL